MQPYYIVERWGKGALTQTCERLNDSSFQLHGLKSKPTIVCGPQNWTSLKAL